MCVCKNIYTISTILHVQLFQLPSNRLHVGFTQPGQQERQEYGNEARQHGNETITIVSPVDEPLHFLS